MSGPLSLHMCTVAGTSLTYIIKLLFKTKVPFLRTGQFQFPTTWTSKLTRKGFHFTFCGCRSPLDLQSFITEYYLHQVSLNVASTNSTTVKTWIFDGCVWNAIVKTFSLLSGFFHLFSNRFATVVETIVILKQKFVDLGAAMHLYLMFSFVALINTLK